MMSASVVRFNAITSEVFALVREHCGESLRRLGIVDEDMRWAMGVRPDELVVSCRVLGLAARKALGAGRVEGLRSRMVRSAQQPTVARHWAIVNTHYSERMDEDTMLHWEEMSVVLRRPSHGG